MKNLLVLTCLIVAIAGGCASSQTPDLHEQCSAGNQAACEELARASYQAQPDATLQSSRPVVPSPASAVPPGNRLP